MSSSPIIAYIVWQALRKIKKFSFLAIYDIEICHCHHAFSNLIIRYHKYESQFHLVMSRIKIERLRVFVNSIPTQRFLI